MAADSFTNQVYVPIRGNNGTTPPSIGTAAGAICGKAKDVHGNAGSDALGCIAIYTGPSDADDIVAAGNPPFAGTPGTPNCHGQSVSELAQRFGGMDNAASALGFSSVQDLQDAIRAFCG